MNFAFIKASQTTFKSGATKPVEVTLQDYKKQAVNLTGATVKVRVAQGDTLLVERPVNIKTPASGIVELAFSADEILHPGSYSIEFEVTYSGGTEEIFPDTNYLKIKVMKSLQQLEDSFEITTDLAKLKSDTETAKTQAVTEAANAKTQADYAKAQADLAKTKTDQLVSAGTPLDNTVSRTKVNAAYGVLAADDLIEVDTANKTIKVLGGHVMNEKMALVLDNTQAPITNYETIASNSEVGVCYYDTTDGKVKYIKYGNEITNRHVILFYLRYNRPYGQANLRGIKFINTDGTVNRVIQPADLPENKKNEKATFVGQDPVIIDFDAATMTFPAQGFVYNHKTSFVDPAVKSLTGISTGDGLHNIYFDTSDKNFKIYKFDALSTPLKNQNLIWIFSYYGGVRPRVIADFPYKMIKNKIDYTNQRVNDKREQNCLLLTRGTVLFDAVAKSITFPTQTYVMYGQNYVLPTNLALTNLTLSDGVNFIYFDTDTKVFTLKHYQTDRSDINEKQFLVASFFYSSSSSEFSGISGTFAYKIVGTEESNFIKPDLNKRYRKAFFSGRGAWDFDFVNAKITIPFGFVLYGKTYYTPSANGSTLTGISTVDGLNFVFFDTVSKTFKARRYDASMSDIDDNHFVIATYYGGGNKTVTADFPYTINGVNPNMPVTTNVFDKTKDRLLLPPKMFFVEGDSLPVYKTSMLSSIDNVDTYKLIIQTKDANEVPRNRYVYEDYVLKSEELQASVRFVLKQKVDHDKFYWKDVTRQVVKASDKATKTPNVLMIGDSITNRNLPEYLKNKLSSYGVTANMVGTMNNTGGQLGEGREGWEYENFIGKDNLHGTTTITRLESGIYSTLYQNPFLKLATEQDKTDHPTWCFRNTGVTTEKSYAEDTDKTGDFYIFDFAWYLANHSVPNPDVVTIALSTNDFSQESATTAMANSRLGLEIMVKQIKSALPNCKIGVIPTPVYGSNKTGNTRWALAADWIDQAIADVNAFGLTGVDIVPIWMHMSRDLSFDYSTGTAVTSTSKMLEGTISDYIHLATSGKREYIASVAAYVMNVI